jgi:hypothetical protein
VAKRVFKKERLKEIVKNIADDFRYSGDVGEYALLFYKADVDGSIDGADIQKMIEYVETGLSELQAEYKSMEWRREMMESEPNLDEIKLLQNMKTFEDEYTTLLEFLQK